MFEEGEVGIGITSDVVQVDGEDSDTPDFEGGTGCGGREGRASENCRGVSAIFWCVPLGSIY